MSVGDWLQNDDLFVREVQVGHRWASYVTMRLSLVGIDASTTPISIRSDVEERAGWADEWDVSAGRYRIEVKSRALRFTSPADYPYATAFVDTVRGWQAKDQEPSAVVLVSQLTGDLVVIPCSTQERWTVERRHDQVRDIDDDFYMIARDLLRPFADFVEWLRT